MRAIKQIHGNKPTHWVGDGFCVQTLINHFDDNPDFNYTHTDPFLLFDYGMPKVFEPNPNYDTQPFGVGLHPHKGFETVTIAYAGELSHTDSAGGAANILEGDVQWMTAGRGIMHEEFHSKDFGQRGGLFSMVQMWINLPQADKLTEPNYQTLRRNDMPMVKLTDGDDNIVGKITLIAGDYNDIQGIASTFTPINIWDIELSTTGSTHITIPNSHNVLLLVQEGEVLINDILADSGKLIQFTAPNEHLRSLQNHESQTDSIELSYPIAADDRAPVKPIRLLLLSGKPIGESIASYGPFVMTTPEELKQSFHDYQTGNFV